MSIARHSAAFILLALVSPLASTADAPIEEVKVTGVRERLERAGRLADVIEKTEVISAEQLERKRAVNLAEAVNNEPGIRVANECSMCGMKRVMINGLKGEQTTILVDGVPSHSVVSSYYGIDAITTAGIGHIEIARGPGSSLAAPEAIGGTINIVIDRPKRNGFVADLAGGEAGYRKGTLVGSGEWNGGRTWLTAAAQYDDQKQFDADDNGVSENPALETHSGFVKFSHDFGDSDNLQSRVALYDSSVTGGPTRFSRRQILDSVALGSSAPGGLFEGGDLRRRFTGNPWETAELVDTERREAMLRWTHAFSPDTNLQLTGSHVANEQDSFYEGFDYRNDDAISYADFKLTRGFGTQHLLSFGADLRDERMRSESDALAAIQAIDPNVFGDSFDYITHGVYLQDSWKPRDGIEVSLALRADRIVADFTDLSGGAEIEKTLLVPRANLRIDHNDYWTSRLSAGRGYRAPLSFFESDHGILEGGFEVDVHELEISTAWSYALSFDNDIVSATLSLAQTAVDNLGFLDASSERAVLRNADETVHVGTYDLAAGWKATPHLELGFNAEVFDYDRPYQGTFSIAPVEKRARMTADYERAGWDASATLSWIGGVNLLDYGYGDRFDVINDLGELSSPKSTRAPAYVTVDFRVAREIGARATVYLGANNLTDYTQAGDEDTPLFYGADGGYDVANIYGPLRGRVFYGGVNVRF